MYYPVIMEPIRFRSDRLKTMMEKRELTPGQLVYLSGVSQPMISLLLSDARPNVSVVIVAKLANTLGTSVDFLVGLTEDPTPRAMTLSENLHKLLLLAQKLPQYRIEDLIGMAAHYAESNETDNTHLMNVLLDKINEVGGEEAETLILDLLESLLPPDNNDDNSLDSPDSDEGNDPSNTDNEDDGANSGPPDDDSPPIPSS